MRTIPLSGKKAAGRVARIDDEDYELVSQYRWYVREAPGTATKRPVGPYAVAVFSRNGSTTSITMHALIMGRRYIDHIDHDTLNNQRYNLRPATSSQNGQNQRPQIGRTSQYKGVHWAAHNNRWLAKIKLNGRVRSLGGFVSELGAAYAYDAAARELFGEFACVNFPEPPTQAMRDQWEAENAALRAEGIASRTGACAPGRRAFWDQREYSTYICTICGDEYQSRAQATAKNLYCGPNCKAKGFRRRHARLREAERAAERDRQLEGRLF